MKAKVGDWIRVLGHHMGDHDRRGEIVSVHGDDGAPPYEVRWMVDDHVSVYYPGSDAIIEPAEERAAH